MSGSARMQAQMGVDRAQVSQPPCDVFAHLDQLRFAAKIAQHAGRFPSPTHHGQVIQTARLFLRAVREQDQREFVRVVGAEENRSHLAVFMPMHEPDESDRDVFLRQLSQSEAGEATGKDWRRLIFDQAGRIVGGVNINDIRRGLENRAEITFWTAHHAIGRGYAQEAVRAAVEHAFRPTLRDTDDLAPGLGLDRLSALISPRNIASIRLVRNAGFSLSPVSVPIELILSGTPASHDEYVLFASARTVQQSNTRSCSIGSLPTRMRHDLKQILRVESVLQAQYM